MQTEPTLDESGDVAAFFPNDAESDLLMAHQAAQLERLIPALSRQIFALPPPAAPLADLPLAQFRLCIMLSRQGKRTMSQLGDELHISVSAVTQMADRLEKVGLVERVAEAGGDKRTRHLQLTAHGDEMMRGRRALRTARAAQTLQQIPDRERQALLHALETLLHAAKTLGKPAAPPDEPL